MYRNSMYTLSLKDLCRDYFQAKNGHMDASGFRMLLMRSVPSSQDDYAGL